MSAVNKPIAVALAACVLLLAGAGPAGAGDPPPFTAREGLALARDAAAVWAADAVLVYLENDEPLDTGGAAARWGYLFRSPATGESRSYSLRDGKVLEAADLDFDFGAPPLPSEWLDSGAILAVAEQEAGRAYCAAHQGRVGTMFLIRGAFHEKNPDRSTWAVVYTSDSQPNLLVIVDALAGKVVRKWEG